MPIHKPTLFALLTFAACTTENPLVSDGSAGGASSSGDGSSTAVDPGAGPTSGSLTTDAGTTTDPDATDPDATDPDATDPDATGPDTTDADSSSDGDETQGDPVCDGWCVPAPEGWNGPAAVYEVPLGGADAGCGDGVFDTEAARFGDGLVVDGTTCGCECGEMTGASCSEPTLRRSTSPAECDGIFITPVALDYGCNDIEPDFNSPNLAFTLGATTMSGGQCEPSATTTLPEPAPEAEIVVCGTAPGVELDALGCASDALCVPDHDGPTCVWAEGDQACPAGFETTRVVHDGFDDTRGCSECACGDPVGTCENGGVSLNPSSDNCQFGVSPAIYLEPLGCAEPSLVSSIRLDEADPVGDCAPSNVVPTGELAPRNPTTVCCTE